MPLFAAAAVTNESNIHEITSCILAEIKHKTPIGEFKIFFSCRILANIGNAVIANAVPRKIEKDVSEMPGNANKSKYHAAAMPPNINGKITATEDRREELFMTFFVK